MKEFEICFIGIGSIAKRHIRNLVRICREDGIKLTIDAVRRNGKKGDEEEYYYIRNVYSDIEQLNEEYDAVFITNPTGMHLDTLRKVTRYGKNFFIEKPIAALSQIDMESSVVKKTQSVYYVACPLRYNPVIQYFKKNIDKDEVISVRSISSSYLPDWRPAQDYRETYSAHKSLGGGVDIDLIHEWDYITYLFGTPGKINYLGGKKSNLEIDSDDYAIYIGEYSDKIVELHLDYFGRNTIREIMLMTDARTYVGDLINNKITYLDNGEEIKFREVRDEFQIRELRHFMDMVDGKCTSDSDIEHAFKLLKLTQGVIE